LLPLFLGFVLLKQEAAQEYQADNARPGGQDQQPAPVKAAALRGRLWDSGYGLLLLCQAENGGIEHGPAGSLGHFSGVVRRDGVAGGVFAGSGAGIGGGGVVEAPGLLPLNIRQGEGAPAVLNRLGHQGHIRLGEIGITAGGGDVPGGRGIAGRLHLDTGGVQGEEAGIAVLRDGLTGGGQQGHDLLHVLALAVQGHGFGVILAVRLRLVLLDNIQQGIEAAGPLKVPGGDEGRIIHRREFVGLADPGLGPVSLRVLQNLYWVKYGGGGFGRGRLGGQRRAGQGTGGQHRQKQGRGAFLHVGQLLQSKNGPKTSLKLMGVSGQRKKSPQIEGTYGLSLRGVFPPLREFDAEHPAVVLLGLQFTLTNKSDKGGVAGALGPLGLLERGNVVMAQDGRDGDHTVAPVHQDQIHQEPGGAPVAVLEGVNIHQPPVGVGGQQDRVHGVPPFVQLLHQPGHKARHLLRRGWDIFRAGDEHLAFPVASGVLRVNAAVEQGVQAEYILLPELQGPAPGGLQHIVIGPGVAGGLVA
ncbi:peptidylprolyl isomerase, partial [Dysosmobacter welbionis]